jgi:hypothetical protein
MGKLVFNPFDVSDTYTADQDVEWEPKGGWSEWAEAASIEREKGYTDASFAHKQGLTKKIDWKDNDRLRVSRYSVEIKHIPLRNKSRNFYVIGAYQGKGYWGGSWMYSPRKIIVVQTHGRRSDRRPDPSDRFFVTGKEAYNAAKEWVRSLLPRFDEFYSSHGS